MARTQLFYGYVLAGYSFVVSFLASAFFLHARGVFFPYWIAEFDVSRTELSLAVSATLFTGAMFAPFMGHLLDRFQLRVIVCAAAAWLTCGYLLIQGGR